MKDKKKKLSIYNKMKRKKEEFEKIDEKKVRMYVWGKKVYDFENIGNERKVIVLEVMLSMLRNV